MPPLILTKHHGLGNDFLVFLDPAGDRPLTADLARALCDRHRGIGADGILRAVPGGRGGDVDVTMDLRNADGSEAEMSGNGIRCLAQAVVDAGWCDEGELRVATAAGVRTVTVEPELEPGLRQVRVDMGTPQVSERDGGPGRRSADVDMGNPHLVALDDGSLDLSSLGAAHPDRNVELITVVETAELCLAVWERGVGPTAACGTGSCAAAAAAHQWGLVGDDVVVRNPGGDLRVHLSDAGLVLVGPTVCIGRVEVPCRFDAPTNGQGGSSWP